MSSNPAGEIVKLLERNTAMGLSLRTVFGDWLDIAHATLSALPDHLKSVAATKQLAEDTPEAKAVFDRCHARYNQEWAWTNLEKAFGALLESTEGFWTHNAPAPGLHGWDILGGVYMQTAYNPHSGQFFTPWNVAEMMARMTILDGEATVNEHLRKAKDAALARNNANSHLLTATILAGLVVPEDRAQAYFASRVLPLIAADFEPITICDPCVGSGVMLLTGARQFPAWAAQVGLIQLYGMDIDATCVKMAQCNMMLYGLGGYGLKCALAALPTEIASLPQPYAAAYEMAQVAHAAADEEAVTAIANDLRQQQSLFDPEQFATSAKKRQQREKPRKVTSGNQPTLI